MNIAKKNFRGETVLLSADIDLQSQNWTPVGQTGATQFLGTFDGQGKTIKNLTVETVDTGENYSSGLFGWLNSATVKNLKITGATITNANKEANGDKCGGIVGQAGNACVLVNGCTVTTSRLSAGRDAGQVAGAAQEANVVNCSASEVTVTANGTSTGANIRNEVIGRVL